MINRKAQVINKFHSDSFRVTFSNFPKIFDGQDDVFDLRIFEYYIKNLSLPDSSLETTTINFRNAVQNTPMSRANDNLPVLSLEIKADEQLSNYYYMWSLVKKMRFGNVDVDALRKNVIHQITVECMDNQGVLASKIVFKNCLLTTVGSLDLVSGSSEELTFSAGFTYEEAGIRIYQDGKEIYNDSEIEAR